MQRLIKFRAWDTPNNNMIQKVAIYGHSMGTSVILPHGDYAPGKHWKQDSYGNYYCCDGSVVPLQYTGLKDKNGKEIYEDDIVESYESDVDGRAYQVVYEDGCFYASQEDKSYFLHELEWEVVANVHENPELLTPTNKEETI